MSQTGPPEVRGSLFVKTFLGFWLVSVAILGSWLLISRYIDSLPPAEQHRPSHGPPERFVLKLIYELQNIPRAQLPALIKEARDEHNVRVWLLDRQGSDLAGADVPPAVHDLARELQGRKRRAFSRSPDGPMVAHKVFLEESGVTRMVMLFPKPRHRVLGAIVANHWLRLLIAALVSGLVCYALSRLLTNRLRELRRASRQLARGELQTRIQVRERGGDETDELARDFNTMAEQLQRRMQSQQQLLSDVSHELRSPLARMRVALALAEEAPDKRPDYLDRMEQETLRLEELISQLLSTEDDTLKLDTHIDLVALLEQLCSDASFEGAVVDKAVAFSSETGVAVIASSGDLLHKSFENIIRNALHHTAEGTTVRVTLELRDGCYRVSVEDEGPGVDEDALERIFDEFYRLDSARSRKDGGFGLGLAIARRAIRRHGGELRAENSARGLIVRATLPVDQAPE
nr:ATP-binding protein [Seongchinamella unica]